MVGRGGFEPPKSVTADLQSAPFGHSGTYPRMKFSVSQKVKLSLPHTPAGASRAAGSLHARIALIVTSGTLSYKEHAEACSLLVGEGGFEPPKSLTADLQSAPFGHSGTLPYSV